jgi:pSer/pThr/pTyr-binding forkhead associated (FHA) protein
MPDESPLLRDAPYLTVTVNHQVVRRVPLKGELTVGRSTDCGLWLEDPILSRHHCQFEPALEGDGWAVVDLESRNGTFVNAKRVERSPLVEGDVVTVGRTHLKFHPDGYTPPRPAGPHEAVKLPANRSAMKTDAHATTRTLPKPAPRDANADTLVPGDSGAGMKPLPFHRPPPTPKPEEE